MSIFFWTVIASVASAILYRGGGLSTNGAKKYAPWKWFPKWMINTKTRDVGCAFIGYIWVGVMYDMVWWVHLLSFICLFGALTTYWDDIFNGVGNFYAHGAICGMAYLPYAIAGGAGIGYILRALIMALFMGIWCDLFSNDYIEECGRGAIIIATLPLLFI
jgi:hypothetical protein